MIITESVGINLPIKIKESPEDDKLIVSGIESLTEYNINDRLDNYFSNIGITYLLKSLNYI